MQPPAYSAYPQAGEVIDGKYQIEKMLGEGGMGAVAKAIHLLRRAPVALKFMSPMFVTYPGAVDRFLNEGVAASQIVSDHVVQVYDLGKLPSGAPYMVMEFLEGRDLADLLQAEGKPGLPVERSLHFVLQILRGLQVAHSAGIVHRDLKPSNAFVITKDGERDFVKLVDFGISKVQQPGGGSLTQTGSALGTPLYMSPEQAKSPKDVDSRSDIYSVAVMLYELLTGRTPFNSESGEFTEILFKLFTADPPPIQTLRPDIPDGLAAAIHHAMARERDHRSQSAQDLAEELAPWAGHQSDTILHRIRTHVARKSNMPHLESMPSSAVAFEKLGSGTAQRMGAPSQAQAASQHVAPEAPAQLHTAVMAGSPLPPGPHSAFPANPAARARPDEAIAATQYEAAVQSVSIPKAPAVPGGATDMAASREAALPEPAKPGRSMVPIVAVVALVVGAASFAVVKLTTAPKPQATGLVPSAPESATVTIAVPSTPVTASAPNPVDSHALSDAPRDAGSDASRTSSPQPTTPKTGTPNTANTGTNPLTYDPTK